MPDWLHKLLGLVLALAFGAICRGLKLPVPAPPSFYGSLLVVAATLGYLAASWSLRAR